MTLSPESSVAETKVCRDCGLDVPLAGYQRTPTGRLADDCKACRRAKYERGLNAKKAVLEKATKEWIIKEAQTLYADPGIRINDKIKLLDTISRNLNADDKNLTDDAKVIRDLIASKKKLEGK